MKLIILIATICVLTLGAGFAVAGDGIEWIENIPFADVLAEAKAVNKPIMIDFYTDWCGPCKKLDKQVWVDPAVKAFAEAGFVNVKIDCEQGEGIEVAKAHKIFNYPSIVFLNPDGSERDRRVGFLSAPEMLVRIQDMEANRNTTEHLMIATPSSSSDIAKVFEVGARLTDQARVAEATPYVDRTLELDKDNALGYADRALLVKAALERKGDNFTQAAKYTEEMVERFPESGVMDKALSDQAYYYKKSGDKEGAVNAYRRMVALHPDDPSSLNAFAWFCATSGVALEEATEVALKAARISQDSPGILDTLAEVYYARGMYGEAIATINKAIAKEPQDSYFKRQQQKFRAAQEGAEE